MNIVFRTLAVVLVLLPVLALGADNAKLISAFETKYSTINDVAVTFTMQTGEGKYSSLPLTGKVTMAKGNKFRVELDGQTVVSDGATLWTYTDQNKQMLVDTYENDPTVITPDKVLAITPSQYNIEVVGAEKVGELQTSVLNLTAKDKNASMKELKIWVDDTESLMRKIQVKDGGGNVLTYTINSIKVNTSPSDNTFKFSKPSGAQTVDLRQ